jgi:mRNA interferase RelE/StbE
LDYRVELSNHAFRDLKKLDKPVQKRIGQTIDGLEKEPRLPGCQKMEGLENAFRVRVGDYRIIYQVNDKVLLVLVIKAGHRRDVYR